MAQGERTIQAGASRVFAAILLPLLSACTTLPGQGPSAVDIALTEKASEAEIVSRAYTVIDLTPSVARTIGSGVSSSISANIGGSNQGNRPMRLGVGDVLSVRIWESSPDGLFERSGGSAAAIPTVVNEGGQIFIPYVGNLDVLGLSIEAVRQLITEGLAGLAVDPQVVVSAGTQGTQTITVLGDSRSSGRFDIPPSGLRLLDAIAIAGGSREASFDTVVRVLRDGRSAEARLDDIVRNSSNNIWLVPRDVVQLRYVPRSFTAFGAVTANKQQPFETDTVTLVEAIAQVGGLNATRADPGGIFLFRFESEERVKAAGGRLPSRNYPQGVPTIYRLDFNTPDAFFLAQSIEIRDKDVIYVAQAPSVEFSYFATRILGPLLSVGDTAANVFPALD